MQRHPNLPCSSPPGASCSPSYPPNLFLSCLTVNSNPVVVGGLQLLAFSQITSRVSNHSIPALQRSSRALAPRNGVVSRSSAFVSHRSSHLLAILSIGRLGSAVVQRRWRSYTKGPLAKFTRSSQKRPMPTRRRCICHRDARHGRTPPLHPRPMSSRPCPHVHLFPSPLLACTAAPCHPSLMPLPLDGQGPVVFPLLLTFD